ncbi:Antitoxin igA-2 [Candidatus Protochlamydia amoebophila]|uniref:helix-turn-helix domain-containing protein n=1 Tax=Candidatus Protochlamydia amoebophila TaxID=362787 RepID=UPI001BD852CF|nr:XRE family transcriptional regulator [Candidatus Protochlamydia amoebophila]MBS4164943.1 Antitoxin igA-2 [Candidatus Protochlamydia amoebophila]
MSKFFKELKEGLEEALIYTQGKITLKSEIIEIPDAPADYKAQDIKRIKKKCHYSQGVFAKILNVSPRTIQSWESCQSVPSHAALRLLEIVDKGIYRPQVYRKTF